MNKSCPICGGGSFGTYRGRVNERCANCGAKERTRMHYMLLSRITNLRTDLPLFHIAPERPISEKLISLYWDKYRPVDYVPELYPNPVTVQKMDLTKDLAIMPDNSVGGFVHSHVLEHVHAPVGDVIAEMNRVIAPGGLHFFSVPILNDTYDEDYSEALSDEDRKIRFGQEDHVRAFGRDDFQELFLDKYFGDFDSIDLPDLISDYEAAQAVIRRSNLKPTTIPQTFIYLKKLG